MEEYNMIRNNTKTLQHYNNILIENNMLLRIVRWASGEIELSTGCVLTSISERTKFRSRSKSYITNKHMDIIYQHYDVDMRDNIASSLKADQASIISTNNWNNLSIEDKIKKQDNMRQAQSQSNKIKRDYSKRIVWNKGKTKETDIRLLSNSIRHTGCGNPMYGSIMSEDEKQRKSKLIKSRIKDGIWTPHIHNSRTHWNCSYNGKTFRSSWEAIYASIHPDFEYETVRIEYEFNGINSVYIVDFIDTINKVLIEIKPNEHLTDPKVVAKIKAAREWGIINGYNFEIVSQQYFIDHFELIDFDNINIPNIRQKLARIKHEAGKKNKNIEA
jgi:hypothetical protein